MLSEGWEIGPAGTRRPINGSGAGPAEFPPISLKENREAERERSKESERKSREWIKANPEAPWIMVDLGGKWRGRGDGEESAG